MVKWTKWNSYFVLCMSREDDGFNITVEEKGCMYA